MYVRVLSFCCQRDRSKVLRILSWCAQSTGTKIRRQPITFKKRIAKKKKLKRKEKKTHERRINQCNIHLVRFTLFRNSVSERAFVRVTRFSVHVEFQRINSKHTQCRCSLPIICGCAFSNPKKCQLAVYACWLCFLFDRSANPFWNRRRNETAICQISFEWTEPTYSISHVSH